MLNVTGQGSITTCDGHTRRDFLQVGTLGALGLTMADYSAAQAAGKVAALAVTGKERSPALPNVPTFAEAGFPEYRMSYWFGLFAPAGTPRDVVVRLEREVARAMTSPALREAFARQGAQPIGSSSAEFTRFVGNEIDLWKKVVVSANVKMD